MEQLKFKELNHGIASRCGDTIYLNKRLQNYPVLREALLEHESRHSPGYGIKDLKMDFSIHELRGHKKEYYKFIISTPSSWTEYSPIVLVDGKIKFSPTIALFWGFAIIVIGLVGSIIL